jgi:L-methionine (R)-S-oxide reductase
MKATTYKQVLHAIESLTEGESDAIAVMATIACELYHAFDYVNWAGFYRRVDPRTLKVGPYQGSHGCLTIDIDRGVCGACVRAASVQIENDVCGVAGHIACSSETRAEIVLPVVGPDGEVAAVLDVDSVELNVFDEVDVRYLKQICGVVAARLSAA